MMLPQAASVSKFLSANKDTSHTGLMVAHPSSSTSVKTLFPIMSHSQAPGAGTSPYLLGRTQRNTQQHPVSFLTEALCEMSPLCPITDPTEHLKQTAFSKFKGGQKKKKKPNIL